MKKILCVCICVLVMLTCMACNEKKDEPETDVRGIVFEAVVKEVNEDSILVMPDADSDEAGVAMEIGLVVMKTEQIPAVKVGDRVRIDYDGVISRSIPGQLGQVYSFVVIK